MIADRVKELSTSTGTGAIALSGAGIGFETFNTAFGIGPSFDYCIESVDDATGIPNGSWEIGRGHLSGATTLVRDTVQQSSNADALVAFGAGTKNVFCTLSASAINALAPLASPALTGNPTAPTPTAGDNDTSIATTAFVGVAVSNAAVPPATVAPLMDATAAVGVITKYAREDHIHPSDTSRLPITGGTLTGNLKISEPTWPALILNKPDATTANVISGQTNDLARWEIRPGDIGADDLAIIRFNDAGASVDYPLTITRATGNVILASTTPTTSPTTGALIVAGGVGIAGGVFAGTVINAVNAFASLGMMQTNGGIGFRWSLNNNGTMSLQKTTDGFGAGTTVPLVVGASGGVALGTATGGDKGAGTLNATSVFDDNVLLTCMGMQYLVHGEINLAQWDALSPKGKHTTAHHFVELAKTFDPRDPKQYIKRMMADEALPGMPTMDEWRHGEASLGELHNRLWLATELLASAFVGLHNDYERRLGTLMQRVEALEKRN